jgi:hypothetical protein
MDWVKNLNLHLENLLPGVVVFFLAALLVSTETSHFVTERVQRSVFSKDLFLGIALVSVAYVLGVLVVAWSRLLDPFSAWVLRPCFLRKLAIQKMEGTRDDINHRYREMIRSGLYSTSQEIRGEILRRRERIHLSRAALMPAIFCVVLFTPGWHWALRLLLEVVAVFFVLATYSYLEVALYDEACLVGEGAAGADSGALGKMSQS